jgi:hypothetical protein
MSSGDDNMPALAEHDVGPELAERIRRRAHVVLDRERALSRRPRLARVARLYDRAIEPTLVVAASVAHLAWALERTLDLLR